MEVVNGERSDYDDYEDDGEDFAKIDDIKVPTSYLGPYSYDSSDKGSTWERHVR